MYVRCGFDRSGSDLTDNLQLYFNKDDVLYVDNTMFNGVPGHWRAWKLDSEGHPQQCGIIPSKYKYTQLLNIIDFVLLFFYNLESRKNCY